MRERYLLAGMLASWSFLYNETPPESSWIWEWYPDKKEWTKAVKKYGENAVRKVLDKYSEEKRSDGLSANDKSAILVKKVFRNGTATTHISPRKHQAVFYNVYIAESNQNVSASSADEGPKLARAVVYEQIRQLAKSHVASAQFNTTVYYVTIGQHSVVDSKYMSTVCNESSRLTCRHLRHYKYGDEDRTLAQLYGYCRRHPSDRVIYIHSKGKGNLSFSFGNAFMMLLAHVRIQLDVCNRILSQHIRERRLEEVHARCRHSSIMRKATRVDLQPLRFVVCSWLDAFDAW